MKRSVSQPGNNLILLIWLTSVLGFVVNAKINTTPKIKSMIDIVAWWQ
jgi:hypothetical protein